jgi:Na+/H+ antiporter NhaD/arsenite permease-like protein
MPLTDAQLAVAIFAITYALIVSERVHKTTAALAGAVAMIAFKVLDSEQAWEAVDLNVIFLLAGMMIIANTTAKTGVFQWIAIRSAKLARGNPMGVLLLLCTVTALLSAFLDNVTTVVLVAPVTIVVAETIGVRLVPMLIAEAIASNIGGTVTLIGDPPNILIGSFARLSFLDFTTSVGPGAILALGAYLLLLRWTQRRALRGSAETRDRVMAIDDAGLITDPRLLRICLAVLAVTIGGFLVHGVLGYEPSAVALMGATVLLLITRADPHEALRDVEWSTLFFFIGLFVVVGGLDSTGVLERVGRAAADASGGSLTTATMLILWMSALLSGVVDNIPYTATMLPVVRTLGNDLGGHDTNARVLWWALAMGADLGGNLTVIGASANVLVSNLAARSGHRISFWEFLKHGVPATALTIAIASAYLWLRFLAFS